MFIIIIIVIYYVSYTMVYFNYKHDLREKTE